MRFVLFSYGGENYARQALLSVCSTLVQNTDAAITVFSDCPHVFAFVPVSVSPLNRFDILAMSGPLKFRHRIKIRLLQRYLTEIESSEPFCYLDSDTFCYRPFPIETDGEAFLHTSEPSVGTKYHARLHDFLKRSRPLLEVSGYADFPNELPMFNAGLIYLPGSPRRDALLQQVLQLTDFLCLWFPQQMEWLEQAAFSYYLPKFFPTRGNDCGFVHYWKTNQEVGAVLSALPLQDISLVASDVKRFEAITDESIKMARLSAHSWQQRASKLRRSVRKRYLTWRATRLRH